MSEKPPPMRLPAVLADGELRLDLYRADDAEAHLAGEDDEMRRRFDSRRIATLEEIRGAMQRFADAAAAGEAFTYAIRDRDGALLGGCELRRLSVESANISYWAFQQHRRRGLASWAAGLLCEAAAGVDGLVWIEAHIDPDNLASRRLAEGLGFVFEREVEDTAWDGAIDTRRLYLKRVRPE